MKYDKTETLLALYRLGRRIKFAAKAGSTDSMLTAAILISLDEQPVTLSELGEDLAMKPAAMSEQIGKLEADGLLTKKTGSDRRSRFLHLTAAGRRAARELRDALEEHGAAVFSAIPASELAAVRKTLARLVV